MYSPKQINHIEKVIFNCWRKPKQIEDNHNNQMLEKLWFHYEDSGYLSARILDYINEKSIHFIDRQVIQELIDSLPPKPFEIMSIHDCFRCLCSYGNDLRKQYNLQLMLIAKSNMLSFLMSQIMKRPITIDKQNPDLWKQIMDTNYALS